MVGFLKMVNKHYKP